MHVHEPLRQLHEKYLAGFAQREPVAADRPGAASGQRTGLELELIAYGPGGADEQCVIPGDFGELEIEYAALRRGAGIMDAVHRATIEVAGKDRHDFLDRMLTQAVKSLAAGTTTRSFLVNRKGRIIADLFLVELGDRILIDVDVHSADLMLSTLDAMLFSEDLTLTDVTTTTRRISLHGPQACDALVALGAATDVPADAGTFTCEGHTIAWARNDLTGDTGVELFVPLTATEIVWELLLGLDEKLAGGKRRIRPVGWFAFNIARLEGGTPLFNIDFGPENLPHESGVHASRVSFKKGCYPGQEVVARIENLGAPKQKICGLRFASGALPVAGAQVFQGDDSERGNPVGVITSSSLSPMHGAEAIALAMLRNSHHDDGTSVSVYVDGEDAKAVVASLPFWTRAQA